MNNNWSDEREVAPKPFGFVPFPSAVKRENTVGQDKVLSGDYVSGRLLLQVEARTHLFVASGSYLLGEDAQLEVPVVAGFYRVGGVPAIPGSSLKGMTRSIVEAVTPACVTATNARREELPIDTSRARDGCRPGNACPACSIFGCMGRLSKVRFGDLRPPSEPPVKTILWSFKPLHNPRPSTTSQVYGNQRQFAGRKFYRPGKMAGAPDETPVEVLPAGTKLFGSVRLWNLTPAEVGALLFGLGLDGTLTPKLGGGKPRCLGAVTLSAVWFAPFNPRNWTRIRNLGSTLKEHALQSWIEQYIGIARTNQYLLDEQVAALREILRMPTGDAVCPADLY